MRKPLVPVVAALTLVFAAGMSGCGAADKITPPVAQAHLRVLNTWPGGESIDVLVGGEVAILALGSGEMSSVVDLQVGAQIISMRRAGFILGTPVSVPVSFSAGDTTTMFALDSSNVINPWVLTDTGATVAAGRSKVRVVHFSHSAPGVLFYRSQPDHTAPVNVMFPFPYGSASPYLESSAGSWTVYMSSEHYGPDGQPQQLDTLYSTGAFNVPAGESRTVVFIDGASRGYSTVILTP